MSQYTGEMPDFFGRRKWFKGLVGSRLIVPVEINTKQDQKTGKWTAAVVADMVTIQVWGIEEALKKPLKTQDKLGFNTQEELMAAVGLRGVTVLNEIIEQTKEKENYASQV